MKKRARALPDLLAGRGKRIEVLKIGYVVQLTAETGKYAGKGYGHCILTAESQLLPDTADLLRNSYVRCNAHVTNIRQYWLSIC